MKVDNVILEGRVKYPKVHRPVKGLETNDKFYEVLVECSPEQHAKLKARGVQQKLKTDKDDGRTYLKASAPEFKKNGDVTKIEVLGTDGKPLSKDTLIGNGSTAKVLLTILTPDGARRSTTRLSGLHVTNLIEYKPDPNKAQKSGFDDAEII